MERLNYRGWVLQISIFLVLKSECTLRTLSVTWLLMSWLPASPGQQQPWYCPCRIYEFSWVHSVNSLWPSDAIWQQRSRSKMAQVLLVTCWHQAISWTGLDLSSLGSPGIIWKRSEDTNQLNKIENGISKITSRSPRDQWVKCCWCNCLSC